MNMVVKCLECGRFCKDVVATINGLGDIIKVRGVCSKCGKVDLTNADWWYGDFYEEEE
jgi:hypothetical protein